MATRIFAKLLRCVRVALNTLSDLKDSALSGIETLWHNLKDEVSPRVTRLKRTVKCKITQSVDGLTERFIPAPLRNWTAQACRSAKSTIEPYLTLITNKIQSSFQTFRSLWKTQVPAWLKVLVSLYMAFWLFMLGVIIFGFTPIGPRAGSRAARWQSSTGNVPPGSDFSRWQSFVMSPKTYIVSGVIGGVLLLLVGWYMLGGPRLIARLKEKFLKFIHTNKTLSYWYWILVRMFRRPRF